MKGISDCTNILIFHTAQGRESQWRFRKTVRACKCACTRVCAGVQLCMCVCVHIRVFVCYTYITTIHSPIMGQCSSANISMCLTRWRKGISLTAWRLWFGSQHSVGPLPSWSLGFLIWDAGMVTVLRDRSVNESDGEGGLLEA